MSRSAIGPEGRICIWLTASLPRRSMGIVTIWSISRRPLSGDRSRCRANTPRLKVNTPSGAELGFQSGTAQNLVNPDPTYNGWYVDASYWLTGETRNYEGDTGEIGRPKVKHPVRGAGGWGAWQIAGRYDVLELSDKNNLLFGWGAVDQTKVVACSTCGDQKTWLIGVNWWLNDYTRLALNVTQSKISGGNSLNAVGTAANKNNGADITGVGLRAQVDW